MWTIRQTADGWELLDADGAVLSTTHRYEEALADLGGLLSAERSLAMDGGGDDGLLPETWVSPIAFLSERIAERDFSETEWVWRDPTESLLPLMLHTETDSGHFGAQLAGFITTVAEADGVGSMGGRFYDTDEGRAARDLLLAGRRYGVSVDPGERTEVEVRCMALDEDGWCNEELLAFTRYDVIGLTMTPFPGFARAHIMLGTPPAAAASPDAEPGNVPSEEPLVEDVPEAAAAAVAAEPCCSACAARDASARGDAAIERLSAVTPIRSARSLVAAGGPMRPPRAWFADPQLAELTAPRYEDDGRVYGHLAPWGQCHTGSAPGTCTVTPRSLSGYAHIMTGYLVCDDGAEVSVGQLSVGGGHADDRLSYVGAIEHYDDIASVFADVVFGEDAHGVWFAGALVPGVTEATLRRVRACPPSGDWRDIGGNYELVAACSVVSQGLTVPRARVAAGHPVSLIAAGAAVMERLAADPTDERIERMERQLAELRTTATAPARDRLRQVARDRLRSVS